jgi:alpha-L-glutamate ligase-like protein
LAFSIFKDHGVLGINARNFDYIRAFNRKKAVRMADSKLQTKQFLSARGIPVPKLLSTIRARRELEKFDFNVLPDSFVLKPNAGFGGEGIIVVKEKIRDGVWRKVGGGQITEEELRDQSLDILDGKFSIASLPDIALFETRVTSIDFIPGLEVEGLPDVRVIVHNLIPVMAMLRIPTAASGGKANVHLGGIGLGIDMSSGKTTFATQYNKLIDELPGGIPAAGHQIPDWDKVLLIASQAQLHTNLGYLAADIVIDEKEGPVLIEVNARAGLMVQIANLAPLKKRLERVKGLSVDSPEKAVKLGKELFGRTGKVKKKYPKKDVVSYIEQGEIILSEGTHRVTVELDPTHETTGIDRAFAESLNLSKVKKGSDLVKLKILLGNQRIQTVAELIDLSKADYKVILGRRDLSGFLIDPTSQEEKVLPKAEPEESKKEIFDYVACDKKLMDIDRKIKLLHYLKPTNLFSEHKKFFASENYNPIFHYAALRFDPNQLKADLEKIKCPKTPLGKILSNKKN